MNLPTRSTGGSPSLLLAEATRSGPQLLLLHGLSRTHGDFAPLHERLAPSWRLIGLDHRGHGRSERAARYLVVDYVADTVRVLRDEIRSPVVILGHSLGAMVAAAVAAELPDVVHGLVLADPPFHAMGDQIAGSAWQAQFLGMRAVAAHGGSIDAVTAATAEIRLPRPDGGSVRLGDIRDPAAIRWSAECLMALDPAVFTPVIDGHWLEGYDPFAIAAAIRCPVHLLQGDPAAGGTLSDADARDFSAAASRCTVERFSGTGHQLHWLEPDRVCAAVAAVADIGQTLFRTAVLAMLVFIALGGATTADAAPDAPVWTAEFVADAIADARSHGDARRGAGVFHAAPAGCTACHRVAGEGGVVGPELTSLAKCLTPEEIVESLYWPDRSVKPDYRSYALVLTDGRLLRGIIRGESPDAIDLVDAGGRHHTIVPADVEERTELGSLMPAAVFTSLPATDRRDLVRYLLELGRTPGLETLSHRAAAFDVRREPLVPEDWPNRGLWVNQHRVYDAYTKQAMQFRGRDPMPLLLPAWPGLDGGTHGHWGSIPWTTWDDDRRNRGEQGSAQCWPLSVGGRTIPRAVSLRLGAAGELAACFNPETLQIEAVWRDGFLRFGKTRYGFLAPAAPAGQLDTPPAAIDLPHGPRTYHGYYRHGKRVIFSYSIGDARYLDAPWLKDGKLVREIAPAESHPLADLVKGGPPQWPQMLTTTGTLGSGSPYAVDTIAPPFDNPWGSLLFFGGHGFFSNGDAAICTIQGDVWRVSDLDTDLKSVRWRRMAAGLNQALGLVVHDDVVYVLGGDQLTRLDDTNGDGEADFYACVTNRFEPSGGHNFKCGLERDAAGSFFTASHQGLLRISPDGKTIDVLAVGFRNPDGLGLLPDGTLTVPVSEGERTPASAICAVRQQPGQPPANPVPNFRGTPPALPMVSIPRGLDHSSGGQAFIASDRWGPLGGQLLHFSFGGCTHFLVLRDEVAGQLQGAVVPLVGDFRSGVHRGRFSPADGQLYVSGMNGWHVYGVDDGCFQRVRYAGGTVQQPLQFHAHRNGVLLRFSAPLDRSIAGDATQHFAQCWNYRYGDSYGSPEFSPSHYGTVGHDPLVIRSATVLSDGQTLFLEMPDIQPVNQLHLHVAVADGVTRDLFATVHALDAPFRDIPHYREVTRPVAAHPILRDVAMIKAAVRNPWLKKVEGARPMTIEAASNLAYKTPELRAKAGEKLALTFVNPDVVPHNWVLAKPGTLAAVGGLADDLIVDPEAVARHYVPKTDDVIAYADITEPGKSQTISFTLPETPGRYPFLCTFPGHWKLMNGLLIVE